MIATHADTALELLKDADSTEKSFPKTLDYQANTVILHNDTDLYASQQILMGLLEFHPQERDTNASPVSVSYYMNRLAKAENENSLHSHFEPPDSKLDPKKMINQTILTHPTYSFDAIDSQKSLRSNNGRRNTWFCGSYFGYGFHEDAVQSSADIANAFDIHL